MAVRKREFVGIQPLLSIKYKRLAFKASLLTTIGFIELKGSLLLQNTLTIMHDQILTPIADIM